MTFAHKLARRLAVLRALSPHCAMLAALTLAVACSAGVPTGVDTANNPADAPVVVNPRSLVLEANQVSVFKAYAKGVPGDSLVTSIEWTATGGTIGLDGTYSSPSTGDFKVVGKRHGPNRTTSDTATVAVVPPQPSITAVVISPDPATVTAKTQQTFSAVGKLSDGSTVAIGVTWTATGGSIDAGGVFTAGTTPGTYQVAAKAASANVADTVLVTVAAPPPTGSSVPSLSTFPNLPAGLTKIAERNMSTDLPYGHAIAPAPEVGTWYAYPGMVNGTNGNGNLFRVSDAAAPMSPSAVLRGTFPKGMADGNSSLGWGGWSNGYNSDGYREVYVAIWLKVGDTTFENHPVMTKLGFIGVAQWAYLGDGSDNQLYWALPNNGTGTYATSANVGFFQQGAVATARYANVGSGNFTFGHWHLWEMYVKLESTPGGKDGVLRIWLDGTKRFDYTNVTYLSASKTAPFHFLQIAPVWGGQMNPTIYKTRTDHIYWDHIAIFAAK